MGIGERLKEEREQKKLTLEDVQNLTKIQTRYLKAIEEERFEVMPGSFYVRAFIKEYATILDLDPEQLIEEFRHELPFDQEETVVRSRVRSSKKNKASAKAPAIFSFMPTIVVVLLIIGIVALVWLFRQNYFSGDEPNSAPVEDGENSAGESVQMPPAQSTTPDNDMVDDEAEEDETDEEQVEEEETEPNTEISLDSYANNESHYNLTTTEEEVQLVITTENANWLEVADENGNSLYEKTFKTDESPLELDISDVNELYLRFGEPQTISIAINDEELELSDEIGSTQVQRVWVELEKQ
ncbi:DUF4115 domain-containing protein [Gracilibacillus sp. S3-1-1]|uniref:DUF4115 domain-containing protein n=1 Tax=Gracilibacillus pellucidus TaxID=3095368 RepID=A0ACC6M832_9BACI|nr:RodZ domain-containing protein [Gracilibacillus sp. S3-1-1]MDX8047002.1 DUF4115 domain-containing protein [Gracilibacillus sp. S3-1-1]